MGSSRNDSVLSRLFPEASMPGTFMAEVRRLCASRLERLEAQGWSPPPAQASVQDAEALEPATPEEMLSREIPLTAFPDVYFRVRAAIDSPFSTSAQIAESVGRDTSLTAKLLRIVNSPLYGFPARIESLPRAISMIGVESLCTLALGISALEAFKGVPRSLVDMKTFWTHSVSVGVMARLIAKRLGEAPLERFFVAGMLHDIGRLVLFRQAPGLAAGALSLSMSGTVSLVQAERRLLGYDHALLGGRLLKAWNLPPALVDLVLNHHAPSQADESPRGAAILQLADFLSDVLLYGLPVAAVLPPLDTGALEGLSLPVEEIAPIALEAEQSVSEVLAAMHH
jgi:putative nucleotidyltransferase with HDIG domain